MKIILALLLIIGLSIPLLRRQHGKQRENPAPGDSCPHEQEACPDGCFCNDKALQRAVKTDIEYFDDEDLDQYAGRQASDYSDTEVARFNEVLTTLRPIETGDWLRSLELRGIALPEELKDIALMLMENNK